MKHYIFMTFGLSGVGGGQCYVASKARYLESAGWHVEVFSEGDANNIKSCPIDYLNKFIPNMMPELGMALFRLPRWLVNRTLMQIKKRIGAISPQDTVFIESHDDITAFWGELLAKKIKARHFVYLLNEHFRGNNKYYEEKIDFFLFKFHRGEILGSAMSFNRLFDGYLKVSSNDVEALLINEDPVQDVQSAIVDNLTMYDYNICYIGRLVKPYVPNIISGVGEFAAKHADQIVHFVIVGDASTQRLLIENEKAKNNNLVITELGSLHPLPKSLFSHVDVVIAGSGSARCSVEEGALTIVADPESKQALGILGYDTNNSLYKDEDSVMTSFTDALERTLIDKVWQNIPFRYPSRVGVKECTDQNFKLMDKADKIKCYYDSRYICRGRKDYALSLKLIFNTIIN